MGEEGITQVAIRVDSGLYERYKAALRAKKPRETTTRNLVRHMWDEVEAFEAQEGEENGL